MQITLAFLVGAPGGEELLLIFVVVLLMFGPKKLPEIARNIGKTMEYLRKTSQEFREQVMRLDEEIPKAVDSAIKDPSSTSPTDTVNPPSITPGIDPYFPNHDPYNLYEDKAASETVDATAPATSGELNVNATTGEVPAVAKVTEDKAATAAPQQMELLDANTEKTIGRISEDVPGPKSPDNVPSKNALAG